MQNFDSNLRTRRRKVSIKTLESSLSPIKISKFHFKFGDVEQTIGNMFVMRPAVRKIQKHL